MQTTRHNFQAAVSAYSGRKLAHLQREIAAYPTAKRRHEALQRGLEKLRATAEIVRVAEVGA